MDLREAVGNGISRHPWEIARLRFLSRVVGEEVDLRLPQRWLDIGSGDGWLASRLLTLLPPGSTMTCFDAKYEPADIEQISEMEWGVDLVAEPPDGKFTVISMFDVIEHVKRDKAFFEDAVQRHMEPGGVVLATVPAYQSLFTSHDAALLHLRRYSRRQFHRIEPPQIRARREGGLFVSLLPVRLLQKILESASVTRSRSIHTGVAHWTGGRLLTTFVARWLEADAYVSMVLSRYGLYLPGLSHWAVYTDAES